MNNNSTFRISWNRLSWEISSTTTWFSTSETRLDNNDIRWQNNNAKAYNTIANTLHPKIPTFQTVHVSVQKKKPPHLTIA